MRDLISLTNAHNGSPVTVAVHAIGIIEPQPSYEEVSQTVVTLSLGKSGKHIYYVAETYEEVIKLIEEAQKPVMGHI